MKKFLVFVTLGFLFSGTVYAEPGKWQQIENKPDCKTWNPYPNPVETVIWIGTCKEGYAEGAGTQIWNVIDDGVVYSTTFEGTLRKGKAEGQGVFTDFNGIRYEGEWKNDKQHGQGVLINAAGLKFFEGSWRQGNKSGHGIQSTPCSETAESLLQKLLMAFVCDLKYDGNWENNLPNGEGTIYLAYGVSFSGNWKNGCLKKYLFINLAFGVRKSSCR